MRAALTALALLACAAPAFAQGRGREVRDVPWYQAHPAILEETLRRCHRDAQVAATWDCQNAEAAAASRMGRSSPRRPGIGASGLPEPDFSARTNPLGRQALIEACANRGPGAQMFLPYCYQLGGSGGR